MSIEEMIIVLEAKREGKPIEFRPYKQFRGLSEDNIWRDMDMAAFTGFHADSWNFRELEYRIKPEPRECWVWFECGDVVKASVDQTYMLGTYPGAVLMREVL